MKVPIGGEIIEFSKEYEADFLQFGGVVIVDVEQDHNKAHIHHEEKPSFESVAHLLSFVIILLLEFTQQLEDLTDNHVQNDDRQRNQQRNNLVNNILLAPGTASVFDPVENTFILTVAGLVVIRLGRQSGIKDCKIDAWEQHCTVYLVVVVSVQLRLLVLDETQ